jgi:hypothetical protein
VAGQAIECAVIALRDANIGVVHDAHDEVSTLAGRVKARADGGSELADFGIAGGSPQQAGVLVIDALALQNFVTHRRYVVGHNSILELEKNATLNGIGGGRRESENSFGKTGHPDNR